jgi:hypothetical protein
MELNVEVGGTYFEKSDLFRPYAITVLKECSRLHNTKIMYVLI